MNTNHPHEVPAAEEGKEDQPINFHPEDQTFHSFSDHSNENEKEDQEKKEEAKVEECQIGSSLAEFIGIDNSDVFEIS